MTDETLPGAEAAAVAALTQIQNSEPNIDSTPADKPEGDDEATPKLKHGAPRDAMYADLVKRRQEAVAKEIGGNAPPPPQPADKQEDTGGDDELEEVRVFPEDPDGYVGKVRKADIQAAGGKEAYGKKVAADIILQRQKDALKRVKEEEARIQREKEELERMKSEATKVPDKATPATDDLTDEEKAEIEHYRDEYGEDVAKLAERSIRAVKRTAQVNQLDVSEISKRAATSALQEIRNQEYQAQLKAADKAFSEQFGHLEQDPKLRQIAIEEYKEVVKRNPNISPVEAVLQAGKNVEEWLTSQGVVRKDAVMAAKEAAKRSMTPPPRPAGARMPATPEEKAPSSSDVIRNMRRARGLPA